MIFVTVGTHEQQFNRLIEEMDRLVKEKVIEGEVVIQTGFSTYEPVYCTWSKLIPYSEMTENMKKADIVITHGGPASFIMPLQYGKIPIVVPRQFEQGEHVNNHQVEFVKEVSERMQNIIPVFDIEQLEKTIADYENICKTLNRSAQSNQTDFNRKFERIVSEMFEK